MTAQELTPRERALVAAFGIHDRTRAVVLCVRRDDPMWERGARALTYTVVDGVPSMPCYFRSFEGQSAWESAMYLANMNVRAHRKSCEGGGAVTTQITKDDWPVLNIVDEMFWAAYLKAEIEAGNVTLATTRADVAEMKRVFLAGLNGDDL